MLTSYHSKYYATQLTLQRPSNSMEKIISSISGARVDLNPHQIDAALFAFRSPLSNGVILADEVGLGKTIEAGIVIAQKWAERKRHILLIVPASLRNQWLTELDEKFFLKSIILESKNYKEMRKRGINPFEKTDSILICSYNYASRMSDEISHIPWDLVVMDEAHRLRNVYKKSNVTGNRLKAALVGRKKILLTATPLQNSLMEFYGLVSMIDEHVFGDEKAFKEMYINIESEEARNYYLKQRLDPFCKRTLRKQVLEYVQYTERHSILESYSPTEEEKLLYSKISEYLSRPSLYALPASQRQLITLVLQKLLASSSFAIAGTIESLVNRLDELLKGNIGIQNSNLPLEDDFDTLNELNEEWEHENEEIERINLEKHIPYIKKEKEYLEECLNIAKRIQKNSKGEKLLIALEKGFEKGASLSAQRKAIIFTESRRTQDYLVDLLTKNGYEKQIVILNGFNNDNHSKEIYSEWLKRHEGEEIVSGSRQADTKAAIIEEFKNNACILIGTEAAAEGINLQFCSLVVNYDLPWNPQRIEQRIGRCHRYGQKHDVVVINFLNEANDADKRVYELLDQKFKLFDGIFGASDEILGAIETGIDFEKRVSEIYKTCRTPQQIQDAFDQIQNELEEKILENKNNALQSLVENFDGDVAARLKICENDANSNLSLYEHWLLFLIRAEYESEIVWEKDETRFCYRGMEFDEGCYNVNWKKADEKNDHFLRRGNDLVEKAIEQSLQRETAIAEIIFDYSNSNKKISYFEEMEKKSGWLLLTKLVCESFEKQEHLIASCLTDDGVIVDCELVQKIFELDAKEEPTKIPENYPEELIHLQENLLAKIKNKIETQDLQYYREECDKLDRWADDLKDGLEREIKEVDKKIRELRKLEKTTSTLSETVKIRDEIGTLETIRKNKRRDLYNEQDKIDENRESLQSDVKRSLEGETSVQQVFMIRWCLE